ncbi:hypothetical protein [Ralstonia phage RSP15]|uniref:head closure Hc2 n=1 Tax=Ralstonia phage RSP15 TaxID=1785960 RepID=UPI00074D41E0|nr:head closure Hc2 [Ralstonia phage RSP15]BAU39999.1 hypothetical protein [Ralstonia phage RSP15]
MINSYVNPTAYPWKGEQDLVQDLTDEAIQMIGLDVKYLKRTMQNRDFLFGESPLSEFKDVITIEMELANIVQFNGDGDMFTKFGIDATDQATFRVSTRRFATEGNKIDLVKPREGDLLHLPTNDSLWEIKKVKNDENFQRFGKNYSYRLEASLFQYSYERLDHDDPDIGDFEDESVWDLDGKNDSLHRTLGLNPDDFNDESKRIKEESDKIKTFNPDDPFGTCSC